MVREYSAAAAAIDTRSLTDTTNEIDCANATATPFEGVLRSLGAPILGVFVCECVCECVREKEREREGERESERVSVSAFEFASVPMCKPVCLPVRAVRRLAA